MGEIAAIAPRTGHRVIEKRFTADQRVRVQPCLVNEPRNVLQRMLAVGIDLQCMSEPGAECGSKPSADRGSFATILLKAYQLHLTGGRCQAIELPRTLLARAVIHQETWQPRRTHRLEHMAYSALVVEDRDYRAGSKSSVHGIGAFRELCGPYARGMSPSSTA